MGINVVEILVRAKNETEAAFAEADADSKGMSKAFLATGLIAGAALAGIGYESIKMATTFQKSMEMLVTQAGVPQSALKGLQTGVLNLAGTVGFSPDSLAESLYHVASNMESMGGTSKQMLDVVKVAAEGARVGGANLVDVTNALTAAVASGIPGVQNYSQAMGQLNAIVGSGDMTMQQLAESMATGVVPVVKGYGLTLSDVGAALATYGDLNIRGAHAGTQLRLAVQALAVPAATGIKALNGIGISANQLATDMEHGGLKLAMNDLVEHMKKAGITGKTMGALITEAFGKKAGAGLALLAENMDRFNSKYPALEKGAKDFGEAWSKTNETLAQKLDDLRGKFDAVMVSIGDKLLPVVTRLASFILGSLIPAIGQVVSWLARHRDVVIAVAAGIATLLVPAFIAWAVAAASAAAATIVAAAPLILIAAGVALLVYAILDLAHHWKQVWDDIKNWTRDAVDYVRGSWDQFVRDIEHWTMDLVKFVRNGWDQLVHDVEQWTSDVVNWVRQHWDEMVSDTSHLINDVVHFFEQLPGRILNALASLGAMLFRAGQNAMKYLISGLESMIGAVGSAVSGIASKIAGFFGLSPAKEGPLSGGGAPEIRGRHFVEAFAQGMRDGLPGLGAAAGLVAGTAGATGAGLAGGGGGNGGWVEARLELAPGGNQFMNALMEGAKLWIRNHGGGGTNSVQRALGQSW